LEVHVKKSMAMVFRWSLVSALLAVGAQAASTLNQFQSVTVAPPGGGSGKPTVRHAVYGDSIFAGYVAGGGVFGLPGQTKRNGAYVESEYLAAKLNSNVDHVGRCVSGATAAQVFGQIKKDIAFAQTANTKFVSVEMCGNDYLKARTDFRGASGCNEAGLQAALDSCVSNLAASMDFINSRATAGSVKMVMNLYYPGFGADLAGSKAACGGRNYAQIFLPYVARGNWRTCDLARQKGFLCADSFGDFMGADYDRNQDGAVDAASLRYVPGETEVAYVARVTQALFATVTDANTKFLSAQTSVDYIQKDDTHPTFSTTARATYNLTGHDRLGFSLSRNNSAF
jgi:hypothetical protein